VLAVGLTPGPLAFSLPTFGGLVRGALVAAAARAGYELSYGTLRNRGGHLAMTSVRLRAAGREPLFAAARVDLAYSLTKIFGSGSPYGVTAVELDAPRVTVVHHADGSWNIPTQARSSTQPFALPARLPRIAVTIANGSVVLDDRTRLFPVSRRLALDGLAFHADLAPDRRSIVTGHVTLVEPGGRYPIRLRAALDEPHGYEVARITAARLGIAPVLDYALNSTNLAVGAGELRDVDLVGYGFGRGNAVRRHLSGSAALTGFRPYLGALAKPLRDGHGTLRVSDDGLAIPHVAGTLAGVPVAITGAITDLRAPQLRLAISGTGALQRLATLSSAKTPAGLTGSTRFALLVGGAATQPRTLARLAAPRVALGTLAVDDVRALVALEGPDATIVRAGATYAGATALARGTILLAKQPRSDLLATVAAPAGRLPYVRDVLGDMTVDATVVAAGTGGALRTTGVVSGQSARSQLLGTLDVDGRGEGSVGPLVIAGPGAQSVVARVALDRPHGGGGVAFVSVRALRLNPQGPEPALPGIALAPPALAGTLDGDVVAAFSGRRSLAAGHVELVDLRARGYRLADVSLRGTVADGARAALVARYRGEVAPLARAAKLRLTAAGSVDLPLAIVANGPSDVTAQIAGADLHGVRLDGIALDGVSATVAVRGKAIDVYAARASLDGGPLVARGTFGAGGALAVSASDVPLAALARFGAPVRSGRAAALATVSGTLADPAVAAGVAIGDLVAADARARRFPLDVSTQLAYTGGTVRLSDGVAVAGPAVGTLQGRVAGLRRDPRAASYALQASLQQADIATLASIAHLPQHPEGTLDATVNVTGRGRTAAVAGTVAIPAGSLNGLAFRGASVRLAGDATSLQARAGRVTVGTSRITFAATATRRATSFTVAAPRLELTDFDGYFDRGDLIGGHGSLALTGRTAPDSVALDGRATLVGARFLRFDLGRADARIATRGRTLTTDARLVGAAGTFALNGTATLAKSAPLRDALHRTAIRLATSAHSVELGTWLPAAGYTQPILGTLDATATVRGTYPALAGSASAALANASVGRVKLREATLAASASRGRVTLSRARLAVDGLAASGAGSFGLTPTAPLALTVTTTSADVAVLGKTLTGTTYDAAGRARDVLQLAGSARAPRLRDILDLDAVRVARFTVPHAHAELAATPSRARLERTEIDLGPRAGRLVASGSLPIRLQPRPAIGAPTAPLEFTLGAEHIDLARFADLLPKGTAVTGLLDGSAHGAGTLARPGLAGTLSLSGASFAGPLLRSKLANGSAQLTFRGTAIRLHDAHADLGGGTLSATGVVRVPSLRTPARDASGRIAIVFTNTVLDVPKLLRGRVLGTVTIARRPNDPLLIGGDLTLTSTRIPIQALLASAQSTSTAKPFPVPVDLDLSIDAASDVRLQGGPVDVGANGRLRVGGTLAAPTVAGQLESVNGGTLSFYRTFRIADGSMLDFDPSDGVIPTADVNATTTVSDPPTDVSIHVTGLATALNVALSSDPAYSRSQILGLLVGAQALGAVQGVTTTGGTRSNPFQAAAAGELGSLLTQNVLEPFSSQLGGALGLSDLALGYIPGGNVSLGATRKIARDLNIVYASTFGYPVRESVGVRATNRADTNAAQLTFFSAPGANQFSSVQTNVLLQPNQSVTAAEPTTGTQGVSFSFLRKF